MSRHSSFSAFFAFIDLDPMEAPRTFANYRRIDKTDLEKLLTVSRIGRDL